MIIKRLIYNSRNDELVRLKGADIDWDQISETGRPYFVITLTYRKTNQTDGRKGTVWKGKEKERLLTEG